MTTSATHSVVIIPEIKSPFERVIGTMKTMVYAATRSRIIIRQEVMHDGWDRGDSFAV